MQIWKSKNTHPHIHIPKFPNSQISKFPNFQIPSLATQADPPPGFDEVRLARAGAALADKRAAAAAKALPALWRSLGGEAAGAFRAYAAARSFPGDHAADALGFARRVCTHESSAAAVLEVLSLRVRSGWPVRVGRARGWMFVAARIAGRPRWLGLPWF